MRGRVVRPWLTRLTGIWVMVLLFLGTGWAQQESSSRPPRTQNDPADPAKPGDSSQTGESSSQGPNTLATSFASPAPFNMIGSARSLDLNNLLHWGPIYVSSASYSFVVDDLKTKDGRGDYRNSINTFQTYIVFAKRFRRSQLALQYAPRMTILNGKAVGDYLNQDANFGVQQYLSPRWTLQLTDTFSYYGSRSQLLGYFLDADSVTGTTVQTRFLQAASRVITSTAGAAFNYQWSARDRLSFGPSAAYIKADRGTSPLPIGGRSGLTYGGEVSFTHLFSERTSIGLSYSALDGHFSRGTPNTIYHTFTGSYRQQVSRAWTVNGSLGVSTADFAGGAGRQSLIVGGFSFVKTQQRSLLSLAYSRGYNLLSGPVSNRYGDRFDITQTMNWTRRLQSRVGVGYQREIGYASDVASGGLLSGEYGLSQVSYHLTRHLIWVADFAFRFQQGDSSRILQGHRTFLSTGLQWHSGRGEM